MTISHYFLWLPGFKKLISSFEGNLNVLLCTMVEKLVSYNVSDLLILSLLSFSKAGCSMLSSFAGVKLLSFFCPDEQPVLCCYVREVFVWDIFIIEIVYCLKNQFAPNYESESFVAVWHSNDKEKY